jgi:hypothetical protein
MKFKGFAAGMGSETCYNVCPFLKKIDLGGPARNKR